jgi:hypothetical protein
LQYFEEGKRVGKKETTIPNTIFLKKKEKRVG